MEIFLQPGEYFFGDRDTRIRTVLGSCVSITFWHQRLLVGGMCHFMLPARGKHKTKVDDTLDGHYADEVMILLLREMQAIHTQPKDYQVKIFGGGDMFPEAKKNQTTNIGGRNIEAARALLQHYGFTVQGEHLGESGHRNVIFNIWSGEVWVKHIPATSKLHPHKKHKGDDLGTH